MSRIAVYRTERELRSYRRKIRRQKEIRRNLILMIATILVLVLFAVSFHSITAFASNNTEDVSYKYFKSIQVEKGDSLWSIADEYADSVHYDSKKDYISEVKKMNKLMDDTIVSGQYLIIPYYSTVFIQ